MFTPVGIYLLKVSNKNTRAMYGICSKLTIKTPEPYQISKMEHFSKIMNGIQSLTNFTERSILDVCQGFLDTSVSIEQNVEYGKTIKILNCDSCTYVVI